MNVVLTSGQVIDVKFFYSAWSKPVWENKVYKRTCLAKGRVGVQELRVLKERANKLPNTNKVSPFFVKTDCSISSINPAIAKGKERYTLMAAGFSMQHGKDEYNGDIGRKQALKNTLANSNFNLQDLKNIWDTFNKKNAIPNKLSNSKTVLVNSA